MGQQQLLLIVLGVIIVGIAIAVGISMFQSNARSSNRDAVINDLNNLAAEAQQFYRKPAAMGGGAESFSGFGLSSADTGNGNGSYYFYNSTTKPAPLSSPPSRHLNTAGYDTCTSLLGTPAGQQIVIIGFGTERGNDGQNHVQAMATVSQNGPSIQVIN